MKEYLIIMLDGQDFAVAAAEVAEVARIGDITRVPCHRPYVLGVFNLRGRVVTALSLRRRLGLPDAADSGLHLVLRRAEGYYSLSVDAVRDVRAWSEAEIAPLPSALAEKWSGFCPGLYQGHERAAMILDVNALLDIFSLRKETA